MLIDEKIILILLTPFQVIIQSNVDTYMYVYDVPLLEKLFVRHTYPRFIRMVTQSPGLWVISIHHMIYMGLVQEIPQIPSPSF